MASRYGLDMDTSIVSDISALDCGDFDMIIEHLLCKPTKKSKRPKKTAHRKVHAAQSVPALNAHDLFNVPDDDEVDNSMANATFSAANTSYLSSFNDTCTTVNSEQFENIFAYFDQDVTTDDLLISEESDDDDERRHIEMMLPPPPPPLNERENLASNLQNLLLTDKTKPKKKQTARQDIQNKSKAILSKIQQFNGIEPTNMSVVGRKPTSHRIPNRRPVSVLSTSSTASLHDSDSDTAATFKKPFSVPMNRGNVRSKVAFFNDHSSSERSSSTSPSVQSTSDDDEYQFKRTESKHKFKQNCNFFENFFKDKQHDQSILDTSTMRTAEVQKQKREKKIIVENQKARNDVAKPKLNAHEKLRAVQTYVQTQYLLERIQRLVTAISSLDEKRLSSMNLRLLKKFLTFIRDCSYNCTEVCNTISQHVLTDFEKNVMSAEELLYTALKEAHSAQPPENELQKSHDTNTNISEHQLRVQASLQRLNIPDWFKQYNSTAAKGGESTGGYVPGSFTKKRNADVQRWTGLSSKTTSLSSLGSHRSDRSPLLLSPSAQSHHGHTGFSRWSTSHLNSSQTSPSASTRGSFSRGGPNASILSNQSSIRGSFRQPYLGWRSQEKLSQPRTPHERLASSMLSRQQTKQQQQQQQQTQSNNTNSLSAKTATEPAVSPEIQTSIKEVTSAIVHYVNDQTNRSGNSRSRSASPSSRRCWLESSFVGNKPMDSPQTPVLESSIGLSAASSRVNGVGESRLL